MVRIESVIRRLQALRGYIDQLRPYRSWTLKALTDDPMLWAGILRYLQLAAQCVMDVTTHLHVSLNLEPADEYDEVILTLGKQGVLPRDFTERIYKIPRFRNILVHEYLTIDPYRVYEILQHGLSDLELFIEYVYDFLRREGYLEE